MFKVRGAPKPKPFLQKEKSDDSLEAEQLFDIPVKKSATEYEPIKELDSEDSDEEPKKPEKRVRGNSMPKANALPSNVGNLRKG
jgi:hypothetical protein